jgi:hypothetical protein
VALAVASVDVSMIAPAHGQSNLNFPFQPSLTDPRNAQTFGPADAAVPWKIVPPSGAGKTGFTSTGAAATNPKKKVTKKPGDPKPVPPPPPPLPAAPQIASGHGSPPPIKMRATYADAYKPVDAPVRRLVPPPTDPYEPLGLRLSTFVVKPTIDIVRGYDTNPAHFSGGTASGFTLIEPSLKVRSDWSRHEAGLDLRGGYAEFDKQSSLNRPLFEAKGYSRIDLSRDTIINTEGRYFLSTDYPGSPNLPIGFAKLPIFENFGGAASATQRFNRLELMAKASIERSRYEDTPLVNGTSSSNQDRDFNQYAGAVRASYETLPGVKPFVEVGGDVRKHDLQFDRDGLQRDSKALTPRVGSTFDLASTLKGEISAGYLQRTFDDPALQNLKGIVADASVIWKATGLTTATLTATSRADETVLAGVSGVLRRDIGVQIDHALRRWLIWTVRAGYGFDEYVGDVATVNGLIERKDTRMSLGSALVYKFNRDVWLKGEYIYDQRDSNVVGNSYHANVFLVGLKLQR